MNNLLQNSKNEIQKKYLLKLLSKLRSPFERLSLTATLDVEAVHSNMMHFSYRLREWPSRMLENKSAKVYEVSMEGQRGKCFSYRGTKLGGNCAIVANCAFPAIPYCLQDDVSSVLPFSKVVNSDETGSRLQLVPSRVAYYEVKIHNVIPPPSLSASDNAGAEGPPCIVVGLGCALFPLRHRMPGWDHFSFGYHSDDGLFFHNETDQGAYIGETFGPGDVVGCGLIYPFEGNIDGAIFFTKNGQHLKTVDFDRGYLNVEWYPMIGIDAYSPVEVNFGECPFMYTDVEAILSAFDKEDYFSPSVHNPLMRNLHEHISIKDGTSTFFTSEKRRACEEWAVDMFHEDEFDDDSDEDFWADFDEFEEDGLDFDVDDEDHAYLDNGDGADYYYQE